MDRDLVRLCDVRRRRDPYIARRRRRRRRKIRGGRGSEDEKATTVAATTRSNARAARCASCSLSRGRCRLCAIVDDGSSSAGRAPRLAQLGHVASFDISMDKQCIDESRHSRDASMSRRGLGRTRVAPLVDARVTRRESSRDGDGVEEIFATHRATFRSDAARPSRVAGAQDARVAVVASRSTPRATPRARNVRDQLG